ncbi:MAG: TonB-dependent receptor [Pseudomonas sp.]|uniref:TonB-dependent receptor plug domain-containing protein n=1 Tax=Pseudomonas sp. TaxID=306 RepID=UPI0012137CA1|nr:TonB-dependent receptor [Pseudomonas sp.]RZI75928.1 MAG: TonB-dependent receptor [Pseudomonas sp.]
MNKKVSRTFRIQAACGAATLAITPVLAAAQEIETVPTDDDIVVTGTILRGAAPVGSSLTSVGAERIAESGATTANELLATVPQVTNLFNTVPNSRLSVASNQIQVVRPRLRNLGGETSSSASTLVLFDGHRISSVGVTQNAIDPDLIPSIAIERVEVVTDGGSSTYGADAVGGVINFITRKRFDGVKVQASYGFADDYYQVQAGAILGKDWGSGSLFAAYNYQHNDAIFGRDRDFVRDVDFFSPNLTPRGRSCAPGNVQIGQNFFAAPGLTSQVPNVCDLSDDSTVVPSSTRHGALVGLHQDLTDWLTVDLRGFYGERESISLSPLRGSVNLSAVSSPGFPAFGVPPSFRNFYYTPVPGQSATAAQTVYYTLAPLLGRNSAQSRSSFQEWGGNAEFKATLNDNWQLRTLFNYSRSNSEFHIEEINSALQNALANGTTAATTINFYNPGGGDAANIAALVNSELAGQGKEELLNLRAILDGTLFSLPGGGVKLAIGYEYTYDNFMQRTADDAPIGTLRTNPFSRYDRRIHSVFGEVQVPIISDDMELGFIKSLILAGSVRYDHFDDVGSTTNPKIGVSLKPVSWLSLRGNYSTSFNAPSPNDQLGVARNTANFFPLNAFVRPGDNPTVTGTVAIQGSNPGLRPQTAKIYSFGFDINPPFIEGMNASFSYYNVKFNDLISIPTPGTGIFANFPNNVISNTSGITLAQLQNFLNASGAPNAATALTTAAARCANPNACNIYELVDFRQGNYGTVKTEGLDFSVNLGMKTDFGGIDAGVSGNYVLGNKTQTGDGAPIIDQLRITNILAPNGQRLVNDAVSRLQLSATLGATVGAFRAQATLNHTGGYRVNRCDATTTPACNPSTTGLPSASGFLQDRVKAFNVVNLFFKYAVPGDSMLLNDLEFTLNVNNLFDTDPPLSTQIGANSGSGYANGFTLGRLFQFGVSKKF